MGQTEEVHKKRKQNSSNNNNKKMLRKPGFWQKEKNAPLFIMENGFLEKAGESVFTRAMSWFEHSATFLATATATPAEEITEIDDSKIPRIVVKDVERTFVGEEHRKELSKFLTKLEQTFGDYSQGLGFVASFVSLFLEEARAMTVVRAANAMLPGYWKHEAVGFATDAYVFMHLLERRNPDLARHLAGLFVLPEMYSQKWFTNLCVHVLPFENVFSVFDGFFAPLSSSSPSSPSSCPSPGSGGSSQAIVGFRFLFQFALSLMSRLEADLIATKDVGHILGILRLDKAHVKTPVDFAEVIESAKKIDVTTGIDFDRLRTEMFEKHLRTRIERAQRVKEEEEKKEAERKAAGEEEDSDEIKFSDEEDD